MQVASFSFSIPIFSDSQLLADLRRHLCYGHQLKHQLDHIIICLVRRACTHHTSLYLVVFHCSGFLNWSLCEIRDAVILYFEVFNACSQPFLFCDSLQQLWKWCRRCHVKDVRCKLLLSVSAFIPWCCWTQVVALPVPCGLFSRSEGPLNAPQAKRITSHFL